MKPRHPVEKPIGGFDPSPSTAVATFFGTGFFPRAPATFTSALVALILGVVGWLARPYWGAGHLRLAILVVVSLVGVWAAGRTEKRYGEDARCIVIDEVAGMLLAALLIPWDWQHLGVAFLLFRVLDVLKPPPGYQLESLPGGAGVMADDLAAGLYALILLFLAGLLVPSF